MGRRYERPDAADGRRDPARPGRTDEDRAQAAWKALDRGEDPTDPPAPHRRGRIAEPLGPVRTAPRPGPAVRRL